MQGGEPLSGVALVARPEEIPGVASWTLDTPGHRGCVNDVEYSPDGKWLGSCGDDGTVRLFSADSGKLVRYSWATRLRSGTFPGHLTPSTWPPPASIKRSVSGTPNRARW